MTKTNKEIVNHLENEIWFKQNEVRCNKSGLIMKRDDFCSYRVRYNIDDE